MRSSSLFEAVPRFPLATLPTPVTDARGLRAALGGPAKCPRILLKRDDLTGLALGGNKARKLEFLVGDALREGATTIVTSGALQSNHARMTAAAARAAGLGIALVLTTREPDPALQGNYLLDHLFGASIHLIDAGPDPRLAVAPDEDVRIREVVEDLRRRGERPYLIPVGGSSAVGALGYAAATLELVGQLEADHIRPSRLYYASGSRGTQAGLELGSRLFSPSFRLFGIAVSGGEDEKRVRAARAATEAGRLLGCDLAFDPQQLSTDQDHIGDGYGLPTADGISAIGLLAASDGVLLDPVYTSKAMAALVAHVRAGAVSPTESIVFLHTGGVPALFAYADAFGRSSSPQ
jgi:D-cysteine desulfhydrase family pyridoxal phosphate-dependent enzyme